MHTTRTNLNPLTGPPVLPIRLFLAGLLLGAPLAVFGSPPPAGVAPLIAPAGGLAIDGDLFANSLIPGAGDWLAGTNPVSSAVLDANGAPLNLTTTFHFTDPYSGIGTDLIFSGGKKWTDNPTNWSWTTGKPSSKTDINNVLLHVATDTDGHTWTAIAADRASNNGDSYIDFEFLQNTLTRNANGGFTSSGPHGGRTTNDLLLSLAFSGGGSVADFFVWRWQADGNGGFAYVDATGSLPIGRVFVALNSTTVAVPYGAFGQTTYGANAFAEAAVDLTALLGNFDPCMSMGFSTIMVKTKASQSSSAGIEDFIDPIQYTLQIGPSADAGADQTRCLEGASTAFPLNGTATAGLQPVASTTWSVVAGTATIDAPASLTTTAHVSSSSATLRLTVIQANDCTETDDIVLTVAPLPACAVTGPSLLCPRANAEFHAPPGMTSYAWSITGNGSISGPTNAPDVTVAAGDACGSSFTLVLNVTSNACSSACATEVMVLDTTPPTLARPADLTLECPADTRTNLTGVATAQDDCSEVTVTYHDAVVNACGGTKMIVRTWTATDPCGNSAQADQTITVRDTTPPAILAPANVILECPADTGTNATGLATGQDSCGAVTISYSDSVSNSCGGTRVIERTWTATDECGNSAHAIQMITVRDTTPPTLTGPANLTLECPADTRTNLTGVATALDNCGSVTIGYSDSVSNGCGGTEVITRTWTATDECGNAASRVQTITVRDTTPPAITGPADLVLECPADTRTNLTGVATAQEGCGSVTIRYSDSVSNGCGGTEVITRTWTATDECGNSADTVQTITVQDTSKPSLVCPPNVVLECPATETGPDLTGTATAQDECGTVTLSHSDVVSNGCGATKVIARTWTAVDQCGNSTSAVQTITVQDTIKPTLICPPNLTLECPANTSTNATGVATAQDSCGSATVRYSDSVSTVCGGSKVVTRTWTATDECGNSASAVQTITVRDTLSPTITCPADRTLECGASTAPSATGTATAQDGCSTVTVSYTDAVTSLCGGSKTIKRTWVATDGCGNTASCVQTIAVRDTTPPSISCAVVSTVSQGGYGGGGEPAQILEANFTTAFPNGLTIGIFNPANGSAFPNGLFWEPNAAGLTALRLAVSQGGGSGGPLTQDAINPADTLGGGGLARQTITLALNIGLNKIGALGIGPNNFGSLVYTNSGGDSLSGMTVSQILEAANRALAGLGLPAGYDFSKLSGLVNDLNMSFHDYTISSWTTLHLSTPALLVSCASQVPAPNSTHITASDACSGPVTLAHLEDVVADYSCPGNYTMLRIWVATDACGNTNTCAYAIIVQDTTPPSLLRPADLVLECPADTRTNVTGVATAQDQCGQVSVSYSDAVSNSCGGARVITRTWTATDGCNSTSAVQTITVRDTTSPTITCPPNRVLECPADTSPSATGVATAEDGCGSATVGYSDSVNSGCGGTKVITRTWTATDLCGNRASCVQTITVQDTQPPTLTGSSDRTVVTGEAWSFDQPVASDACGTATVHVVSTTTNMTGADTFVATRTWTAVDECGNARSTEQTITVMARPVLELLKIAPQRLMLRWPIVPTGFQAQVCDSLSTPDWSFLQGTYFVTNGFNCIEFTPDASQKIFRLSRPLP